MPDTLRVVLGLLCWLYVWTRTAPLVYLAQRESYQVTGYIRHHLWRTIRWPDGVAWLAALATAIGCWAGMPVVSVVAVAASALCGLISWLQWRQGLPHMKVRLVWTARAQRLAAAMWLVSALMIAALTSTVPALTGVPAAAVVWVLALAMTLTRPLEMAIQQGFKRQAQTRLAQLRSLTALRVVGITGSYGKTSSKFILASILSTKYDVLATPASYNTPMGICKVVNEQLQAHHQVFIAEMGARHRGDIRELANLVQPDCAIITAVGPAHLETLGSLENIAHTKFDLARGTAPGGPVVVNGDNPWCRAEAQTLQRDVLFYGLSGEPHLAAYARDLTVSEQGTTFTLVFTGDGEIRCQTKLLGKHNVLNIVGAALLARRMGLSLEEIAQGIARIQPVEHRLQLIDPGTGVLIIDDAFNSNPEGAAAALEVLAGFHGRRKWIVTPGMVELGAESAAVHRAWGERMAAVCDRVVLVGRLNADAMLAGLRAAGFPEDHVMVAASLAEAQQRYLSQLRPGDVVLFENDLPDHLERG
ncbi:MAG: UDP-N-acetylmuramoyl-tripeptide--D-alanyl-D-alanine ligase [Alicyclobacillus sp.]|nr:UDP-N-acetylmuramoyl-tripeptide--D-alanyl-D-alanine ligase [Alicyclobacillus sp.]